MQETVFQDWQICSAQPSKWKWIEMDRNGFYSCL